MTILRHCAPASQAGCREFDPHRPLQFSANFENPQKQGALCRLLPPCISTKQIFSGDTVQLTFSKRSRSYPMAASIERASLSVSSEIWASVMMNGGAMST